MAVVFGGPVQAYGPELEKRCRHHLKPTAKSYRVDETCIRIRGESRYLYRAVDKHGRTIDFLLTARRDASAAKRFFRKALEQPWESSPAGHQCGQESGPTRPQSKPSRQRAPYAAGVGGRQCKYLNNVIEQDHRTVKKRVWLAKGYESFRTAWRTMRGIEAMCMIRKGRLRWVAKGDAIGQARFISKLFGLAA